MNFKITMKYLNITNYPYVEEYLEDMASRGWLLRRIIVGSIFIFTKIKPEELKFSISPYEVETAFTRRSKEELQEFESVCESVGWNYCTRSYDLHIYYKQRNSDALDIHTDIEEEFNLLEQIGKKQIRSYYILLPLLIFLLWSNVGRINSVDFIRTGLLQMIIPILPIGLILTIYDWIHIQKFLKTNRQNIDEFREIQYSDSKFYFTRFSFILVFLDLLLIVAYVFYAYIFLKNKIILIAFLPAMIGIVIGQLYRVFVKPSKNSKAYKKTAFGVVLILAIMISNLVILLSTGDLNNYVNELDRTKYKVILNEDFSGENVDSNGTLTEDVSILAPKSYKYISRDITGEYETNYLKTEYSKALTENIAKRLVNSYKAEAEEDIRNGNYEDLKYYYKTGDAPVGDLMNMGLTRADFDELKEKVLKAAIEESLERIKEGIIVEADSAIWDVDEIYFMGRDKMRIVLRKGKEVFLLVGKDFEDRDVIKISREKLGLAMEDGEVKK